MSTVVKQRHFRLIGIEGGQKNTGQIMMPCPCLQRTALASYPGSLGAESLGTRLCTALARFLYYVSVTYAITHFIGWNPANEIPGSWISVFLRGRRIRLVRMYIKLAATTVANPSVQARPAHNQPGQHTTEPSTQQRTAYLQAGPTRSNWLV